MRDKKTSYLNIGDGGRDVYKFEASVENLFQEDIVIKQLNLTYYYRDLISFTAKGSSDINDNHIKNYLPHLAEEKQCH